MQEWSGVNPSLGLVQSTPFPFQTPSVVSCFSGRALPKHEYVTLLTFPLAEASQILDRAGLADGVLKWDGVFIRLAMRMAGNNARQRYTAVRSVQATHAIRAYLIFHSRRRTVLYGEPGALVQLVDEGKISLILVYEKTQVYLATKAP